MRRINNNKVEASFRQGSSALHPINRASSDSRASAQTIMRILGRVWKGDGFFNVFHSYQTDAFFRIIHDKKLFNPVLMEKLFGFFFCHRVIGFDEIIGGHKLAHRLFRIIRKTHITVGQNTNKTPGCFSNRNTGNVILLHQKQCIFQRGIRRNCDWINNHARFKALHFAHFIGLLFDLHIAVDDPDTTILRHGNRHLMFTDRIHCGRKNRQMQCNRLC